MKDAFWEWDEDKAERNVRDHGVTFEEAKSVFKDKNYVELYDEEHSEEEGRFAAIGFSRDARLLIVIFTPRGETIRLITARVAEQDEETIYEQGN